MTPLLVVAAGAAGACARFAMDHVVYQLTARVLPMGTLVVNVLGSLAAGALAGVATSHGLDETTRLLVGTGFLGAFTTYSTYAVETVRLVGVATRVAILNAAAGLVATMAAAALGYALAAAM